MSGKVDLLELALVRNMEFAAKFAVEECLLQEKLQTTQTPPFMWIGCSDSRCCENTLLGAKPGDVFSTRNIANIVDASVQAAVSYAVEHLHVKYILLAGHTGCGGISAALQAPSLGCDSEADRDFVQDHIRQVVKLRDQNEEALRYSDDKALALTTLNVRSGYDVLMSMPCVSQAVHDGKLQVHTLIYDIKTNRLRHIQ